MKTLSLVSLLFVACGAPPSADRDGVDASALTIDLSYTTDPQGDRLTLCGRGSLANTNAYLASNNQRFIVSYPGAFPNPYWGIDKTQHAYICIGVTHYANSNWHIGSSGFTGGFDQLELEVYGFRTNSGGKKIDVNGDQLINDDDFGAFQISTRLKGVNPAHTHLLANALSRAFNANIAEETGLALSNYDASNYPNKACVGSDCTYLFAQVSPLNEFMCSSGNQVPNACVYYLAKSGEYATAFPKNLYRSGVFSFENFGNNWVKFDPSKDAFTHGDAALTTLLNTLSFEPLFWVRAQTTHADFHGEVYP